MKHFRVKILIAIIWLVFTVSLAGWWFVYTWNQIEINAEDNVRTMLQFEGVSLLVALLAGGAAIVFLIFQERKSYKTLNDFHLAFSHDLKNSMTSLQMQVGALRDEYREQNNPVLQRLDLESKRLQMKLENSLELSRLAVSPYFMENISLSKILAKTRFHEPEIELILDGDQQIHGDRRALEIIFQNLFNNAVKHGQATRVSIKTQKIDPDKILLRITDNGSGFNGEREQLAKMISLGEKTSGSGIGLYLVDQLVSKMDGKVSFPKPDLKAGPDDGFQVLLTLKKGAGG
ncbi:MAG: HAMP domain-containing histidine kinase [Devosiaceae bacterium]|nr:HAMP domain-containing histidine kinase [Devosiaceae bacterium]